MTVFPLMSMSVLCLSEAEDRRHKSLVEPGQLRSFICRD
jgi:hypothetical protein